jgi:hypothetical protein
MRFLFLQCNILIAIIAIFMRYLPTIPHLTLLANRNHHHEALTNGYQQVESFLYFLAPD